MSDFADADMMLLSHLFDSEHTKEGWHELQNSIQEFYSNPEFTERCLKCPGSRKSQQVTRGAKGAQSALRRPRTTKGITVHSDLDISNGLLPRVFD